MSNPDLKTLRRLTIDEKELIVEMILNAVPKGEIAARVPCHRNTVTHVWNAYLDERISERREQNDREVQKIVTQLQRNAEDARKQYVACLISDDLSMAQKFMESERKAVAELAKYGAIRDAEPGHAAQVTAAQAASLAAVIKESVDAAGLPPAEKAAMLASIVTTLRTLNP